MLSFNINAQKTISYYQFSETVGTFTSISTTGTNLGTGDDSEFPLDLSGSFSFTYNENSYSQFTVGVNGAIILGTTTAEVYYDNNLNAPNTTPYIAPYWDDMDMTYTNGNCYYELSGSAGSQVLTIEWHDVETYDDSKSTKASNVSYQLKLYETDGKIEFIYGDMSNAINWYPDGGSIGFNDTENSTLTFLSVTPGSPATYSTTVANDNISKNIMAAIADGTTYTFTYVVPTCFQPDNLNAENITVNSALLSWDETATATNWDIEWGVSGFTQTGTPTIEDLTTTNINLTGLNSETAYEFFVRADCSGNNSDVSYWTGPYEFTTLADCPEPTDLTVILINETSANLGWEQTGGNANWDVEWGLTGFSPTGTPTNNDISTKPLTITGLSESTSYDFYVRNDCGGFQSSWVGPRTFTTPCSPTIPPYTQDFSSYIPACWDVIRGGFDEGPVGQQGVASWNQQNFGNQTDGSPSARINLYNNNKKDWLISPQLDMSTGGYEVNFDIALTKFYDTLPMEMGSDDEIKFVYTEDGLNWQTLYSWTVGNEPSNLGDNILINIENITATHVRFAFWASEGEIDDPRDYDVFVDNFVVRLRPTCPQPSLLNATDITSSSANLTWQNGGNETMWDIELGIADFVPTGTPTYDNVTSNPFGISDLLPTISYDFYVRADCGGNNTDVSEWVGPFQFSTAYSVPFEEKFDTYLPNDWKEGKAILENNTYINPLEASWEQDPYLNSNPSNQSACITVFGTYRQDWLISPKIDLGTNNNSELKFNLAITKTGESGPPDVYGEDNKFAVIISTDAGETWSSANALQMWDNTSNPAFSDIPYEGQEMTFDLSAYSGTVMFGFYAESTIFNGGEFCDIFVDELRVNQTVGIKNISNNISIYPNPSSGFVNIVTDDSYKLKVYNISGQIILEKNIVKEDKLFIHESGIYLLNFSNNKKSFTKRLIVK